MNGQENLQTNGWRNNKVKIIGAWMIIIGMSLAIFSINDYLSAHKINDYSAKIDITALEIQQISDQVLPKNGYETNAQWGDIGPNLINSGVIDIDTFKGLYDTEGGLKADELEILAKGSTSKIKITAENSHFVLNMLWALGLAQKNILLTEGEMSEYGDYKRFASTGGWTITKKPLDEIYSKFNWLHLDSEQEKRIEKIARNIYRPCCNNSTAFPDCNHGMAALGLIEILVANGNSDAEIYDALKYFNSFWFSSSYLETAIYFKKIKNIDWNSIDPKEILSKEYSSGSGWAKNIHAQLEKIPELLPKNLEAGGCGA